MQRKYNMALQHFYQAATNRYMAGGDTEMREKLRDLSAGSEDELFSVEKSKTDLYEKETKDDDKDDNDEYFTFQEQTHVRKPNGVCSKRGCLFLLLWLFMFIVGVIVMSFFIHYVIKNIAPRKHRPQVTGPVVYERYHEIKTEKPTPVVKTTSTPDLYSTCSDFEITKIWEETFEKHQTEAGIRVVDVNNDGIDDLIVGFVTTIDGFGELSERRKLCDKYFNSSFPCFGGVMALCGRTGHVIWKHYSLHEVYAVNCNGDIDADGIPDCLCAGRGGVFEAVSGKKGNMIWMFLDAEHRDEKMNLYTPQFIHDLDGDGVMDVLQIHGGDPFAEPHSPTRLIGKILILSGKTGLVLSASHVPDGKESYSSPVLYTSKNGTKWVVFGTGGETHGGALYIMDLQELYYGHMQKAFTIERNEEKGYMNPPILVDLNNDGTVDLVSAAFGTSVSAYDGETLQLLWTYESNMTESYSVPAIGYYNKDLVPDLLIRFNYGPGFPVYYHSQVLVLDGSNGQPLTHPFKTSGAAHSSPLTVSMEGTGNDLFVFWSVDCVGHEHEGGFFQYVNGTNVHESSRADSCKLRFNTSSFSNLHVMNRKMGFPGVELYSSLNTSSKSHASKRHIGVPDHGGMQRIIQSGTIIPSLNQSEFELSSSFDVVFATYYMKPAQVRALLPVDLECVKEYKQKAKKGMIKNDLDIEKNLDNGIYDHGDSAVNFCLEKRLGKPGKLDSQESLFEKNLNYGKMTVHRHRVTCKCRPGENCARVLPKREQGWTGYMGSMNNGYFVTRPHGRFHDSSR